MDRHMADRPLSAGVLLTLALGVEEMPVLDPKWTLTVSIGVPPSTKMRRSS
jgi:hypothetical protein